jgi:succinate-semialdehyde dehydrogenase/glutarate-semialdehyde dehydrogenase
VTAFAERLKIRLQETFKQGSVWDPKVSFGPLYGPKAIEKVERHVKDATSKGARVFLGGHIDKQLGPNFYVPTILTDTTREMLFFSEETFGPVAPLTPFDTEEEAIQIANETNAGLAAYFYTEDISRLWRVSEALEAGMVGCRVGLVSAC